MNTEIEDVQNVEQANTIRKYALQRINLMIEEERKMGKSEEEIRTLIHEFHACIEDIIHQLDSQQQMLEDARKQIEKEQNSNPYEMGGRSI